MEEKLTEDEVYVLAQKVRKQDWTHCSESYYTSLEGLTIWVRGNGGSPSIGVYYKDAFWKDPVAVGELHNSPSAEKVYRKLEDQREEGDRKALDNALSAGVSRVRRILGDKT